MSYDPQIMRDPVTIEYTAWDNTFSLLMESPSGKKYALLYNPEHKQHGHILHHVRGRWITFRWAFKNEMAYAKKLIDQYRETTMVRTQAEHNVINARRQLCTTCKRPTGRCEDDTIYDSHGNGPLCPECHACYDDPKQGK